MNTQTHMLMGAALFGSAANLTSTLLAAAGGLAPDLPMFVLVASARWLGQKSPREIFGTLYFSRRWQALLAPWHSVPLWGLALGLCLAFRWSGAFVFVATALIHIALDFFLHHDDAHQQFWPLSAWRFKSPVSYWDGRRHGHLFRPFEMALALGLTGYLMTQYRTPLAVTVLASILALYAAQLAYFWHALRLRS